MLRSDIINILITKKKFSKYLEIGTYDRKNFNLVSCLEKTCVDPDPRTNPDYLLTSDDFFSSVAKKYDIIFIDGLHKSYQVERDIYNSLAHLSEGGVVVLHDCNPSTYEMQIRDVDNPTIWTGDVWKAFTKYRTTTKYFTCTVDTDYGCGIIDTSSNDLSYIPELLSTEYEDMSYESLIENRKGYLGLVTEFEFLTRYAL